MAKNKAIIFDFDGVIADTLKFHQEHLKKYLNISISKKEYQDWQRGNVYDKNNKITNQKLIDYFKMIEKDHNKVKSFAGINKVLKELSKSYNLFIITSSSDLNIINLLKREGTFNCFKEILGVEFNKSKIVKFNYIIDKYSLEKDDILFVTDTSGDVFEANKVGLRSIGVTWGFHDRNILAEAEPFAYAGKPEDILEIVEKNFNNQKLNFKYIIIIFLLLLIFSYFLKINNSTDKNILEEITNSIYEKRDLIKIENPNLETPEDIYQNQLLKFYKIDNLLLALAYNKSMNFDLSLLNVETNFSGILIANKNDKKWKKFIEIKDVKSEKNNLYYVFIKDSKLNLVIIDHNGAGSGEGVMKVFYLSKEDNNWKLENCYYYIPEKDNLEENNFDFDKLFRKIENKTCENNLKLLTIS